MRPHQNLQDLQEQLKRLAPQLPSALRAGAGYFLDHPGAVATLSMRQLAAAIGTSPGNLPRLAKALGYATYAQLKQVYSAHVQGGSMGNFHLRAQTLQRQGSQHGSAGVWEHFKEAAQRNVDACFAANARESVEAIAERMLAARTVYIAGMQSSLSSAFYAHYLGTMVLENCRIISGLGGVFADEMVALGAPDVLFAVALRPCSAFTIRIAQKARAQGAFVVGCTDSAASPLALSAHAVLLVPDKSPMFFDSYLAVTLLIEVLTGFITLRSAAAVARIEAIDACRAEMGESWSGEDSRHA